MPKLGIGVSTIGIGRQRGNYNYIPPVIPGAKNPDGTQMKNPDTTDAVNPGG